MNDPVLTIDLSSHPEVLQRMVMEEAREGFFADLLPRFGIMEQGPWKPGVVRLSSAEAQRIENEHSRSDVGVGPAPEEDPLGDQSG